MRAGLALSVVGGRQLRFLSSDGAALSPPLPWCSIDAYDRLPLKDAVRTGRDIVLNATEFASQYPVLFARQGDGTSPSVVALALRAGERRLGGLLLYRDPGLADPLSVAGRGLRLVDAVSCRWGATSTGSVSCVWYELDLGETG